MDKSSDDKEGKQRRLGARLGLVRFCFFFSFYPKSSPFVYSG